MDTPLPPFDDVPDPLGPEDSPLATALPVPDIAGLPKSPTRIRRRLVQAASLTLAAILGISWLAKGGVVPRPGASVAFALGAFALPLSAALWAISVGLSSGRIGLGAPVRTLGAAALAAFCALAVSAFFGPVGAFHDGSWAAAVPCAIVSTALGALGPLAFVAGWRRAIVAGVVFRLAAVCVASGVLGAVLVRARCPNDAVVHVLFGHGSASLFLLLLGVVCLRRPLRV